MEHTEKLTQENSEIGLDSIHSVLTSIYEELKAIREQNVNIALSGNSIISKEWLENALSNIKYKEPTINGNDLIRLINAYPRPRD